MGVDFVVLMINMMYWVYDVIEVVVMLLFLYIVDLIGSVLCVVGVECVVLFGMCYMMELLFYVVWLCEKFGFDVLVLDEFGCDDVYWIIYDELCYGVILM